MKAELVQRAYSIVVYASSRNFTLLGTAIAHVVLFSYHASHCLPIGSNSTRNSLSIHLASIYCSHPNQLRAKQICPGASENYAASPDRSPVSSNNFYSQLVFFLDRTLINLERRIAASHYASPRVPSICTCLHDRS